MRGGRVGFIENRARLAQHHHARRMTVLRELWYCHVAVLSFHASSPSNPPRFPCAYPFLSDFRGQFWRSSGTQTGSCGISSESSRRPLSNDIKFARIGVRTRELWLPEVGVSELFSCTLPMRRFRSNGGCYSANREFHDVAGVIIFPTHPGSRINLLRAGKTLRAKAAVREKKCVLLPARFFSNLVPVPDSRESELGLVRYGPASRVHRGVFGPFEGSFPIRIPADPDKFLAIREFHVVHGCVLFPMCPGSQINLLRVRKTLCASVATSALHRGELGFARYDPANGGRRNVPYAKGGGQFDPVFGLVNGPVKPWSNLVNLGQTWSDLVKALQTLGSVPRTSFQGFLGKADPSRAGNSSVKPRTPIDDQFSPIRPTVSIRDESAWVTTQVSKRRTNRGRIGLGDHPGLETKFVIRVRIGLGDHPGLETETNRGRIGLGDHPGLETKFVIRVRIGLGDHPGLETETNRGRIGLGDHPGLETKFVIRVRIGLGDHPGLETETNRGRIGLGDHPGLETETNRGRIGLGDHPGLETKFVIRVRIGLGDHPGLETETNRGRIGLGDHPGLETKFVIRVRIGLGDHPGLETERIGDESAWVTTQMSDRGSGSGGHRRSDRLAKGKAVAYAPESSPDTDDEYDAMEDVRTRVDASLARDLQAEFDAEAAGSAPSAARAPPRPGVVIGRSAGPSETTRPSPQPSVTTGSSDAPPAAPRRAHTRYPPHGGIRPRYPVAVEISDTPLLTNLLAHPSSLVRRCQEPPYSAGRGGWSEFSRLLAVSRPEYREFLIGLGFGPFLSIPYVSVYHPAVWCFIERFFHHTGTFHLSTCEMAVLPVDWSAILGIRFGGRAPPSEPIDGFEAREILGLADHDATEGTRRPSVRIRYLADVLRRDREEPPTELRYRQWAAYFIFSCFLGNDRSIVPTPIVGMFRDIDTLREYDWGALTYGFYIRGLRRYSRRESISFLGFWQFTVFWAFEHFPTFAPSRLPLASDPDFPLARRWDTSRIERMTTCTLLELRMTVDCLRDADIIFQPYSAALSQRPEVFRAVALSRLRLWIRTTRSWELLLGERTVRQLGDEAVVPVDPSPLMTIEDYIPRAPSDPYIAGVSAYPSLVREGVPYQEWFEQVSLGSLMSLHEVEGGRVMGGVAMDSHHIRSSGQIERLEGEVLRLQLELSVSADRYTADMASMQTEATRREGEMVQMQRDLAQSQRDLGSRDAEVARLAAAVRRLEDQLHGMGITPVTGADLSGPGQPSSSPPRDPVSRDWFFDDPSPP
uniref:Aminotransferase-like plant mobile domain-containing protein n=1 Tax=Fagus sylvatica TaxID=28930 RepID=A0A2N9FUH8_FAGSY